MNDATAAISAEYDGEMSASSQAMAGQGSASVPIPYLAQHDGPRRVLHLQLRRALKNIGAVHVNIDGLAHVQRFGPTFFEIPADRPVTIRVHQFDVLQRVFGNAVTVLEAGTPAELEYQAPAHPKEMGEIGPPGTTNVRGRARFYRFIGGLIAVPFVLLFVFIIVIAILVG